MSQVFSINNRPVFTVMKKLLLLPIFLVVFNTTILSADDRSELEQLSCQISMRAPSTFNDLSNVDKNLIKGTEEYFNQIIAMAGVDTKLVQKSVFDKIRGIFLGIPRSIRPFDHGQKTFRHYVQKSTDLIQIIKSSKLKVGPTPYVEASDDYFRITYPDVRGIFFTDSTTIAEDVGVNAGYYIDFKLYSPTKTVEIERSIYLIPTKVRSYELKEYDWAPVPVAENVQYDIFEIPIQVVGIGFPK